jgi:hypothetical protein
MRTAASRSPVLRATSSSPVVRREDLEDRVGCHPGKATITSRRDALLTDERDIRASHCVGIRRQDEARLDDRDAFWLLLEMRLQQVCQLHHDPAVVEIRSAHTNEPAFDELVLVVRALRHSCELFRRNESLDR